MSMLNTRFSLYAGDWLQDILREWYGFSEPFRCSAKRYILTTLWSSHPGTNYGIGSNTYKPREVKSIGGIKQRVAEKIPWREEHEGRSVIVRVLVYTYLTRICKIQSLFTYVILDVSVQAFQFIGLAIVREHASIKRNRLSGLIVRSVVCLWRARFVR